MWNEEPTILPDMNVWNNAIKIIIIFLLHFLLRKTRTMLWNRDSIDFAANSESPLKSKTGQFLGYRTYAFEIVQQ